MGPAEHDHARADPGAIANRNGGRKAFAGAPLWATNQVTAALKKDTGRDVAVSPDANAAALGHNEGCADPNPRVGSNRERASSKNSAPKIETDAITHFSAAGSPKPPLKCE
jgi:hypothetical protein